MKLDVSSDEELIYFFERVINYLKSAHEYEHNEAVELVNRYYSKLTNPDFCKEFGIPFQNIDTFYHIEARSMADRVKFYEGLNNTPDESKFIDWQNKIRKFNS